MTEINRNNSQLSVLVVDDYEAHRYIMQKTLGAAGFAILLAADGEEALEMARTHKPDAILLDIGLPDIRGYEVCTLLKANPETRDIPIIFHSSTHAGAAQDHARLVGGAAFVNFPIEPVQLRTIIQGTTRRLQKAEKGPG